MPRVLIVDIVPERTARLGRLLQDLRLRIETQIFHEPAPALIWAAANSIDLLLVDGEIDHPGPLEFIGVVRELASCIDIPLVILTNVAERQMRRRALEIGATDCLVTPFDDSEFQARCRNLLTLRQQQEIIRDRTHWLEKSVLQQTQELHWRERETLLRLAKAGEYRDSDTGNHVLRMASYSRLIAEELGFPQADCDLIELAAPMHDIGKIGIPDHILLKPSKLTTSEWEAMQQHTWVGYDILRNSPSKYLQKGAIIALSHHERFEGRGYPQQLRGEEIPIEARIVTVADVFDALVSERPYKRAWDIERALGFLRSERGKQFDPDCVNAFLRQIPRIHHARHRLSDISVAANG